MFKLGYEVVKINQLNLYKRIEKLLIEAVSSALQENQEKIDLINLHHYCRSHDVNINNLRLQVIDKLNNMPFVSMIYECLEDHIKKVLGPDLLAQKGINLVIQMPNDPEPSEPHRDFPANSAWELVAWVPFMDCTDSRAMYVCDVSQTIELNQIRRREPDICWERFASLVRSRAAYIDVKYGEVLFFQTPLYHGSDINRTDGTRVSINHRFKNLFSPSGMKDDLQFFTPVNMSTFASNSSKFYFEEFNR